MQHPMQGDAVNTQREIEEAFHGAVADAVGGILAGAQEAAAQHGSEADGDHAGNQNGGTDGDGELAEEAAQDARHEQNRNEHRGQRKRHADDGEADLAAAGERRLHGRFAHLDMADNVLQHDDGVVHHEADREDQRHHGDIVQAEVEQLHDGKGAHDGKGQRHGGDHGGREVAQESKNDQHHQDQRGGHGELYVLEGLANVLGTIAADAEAYRRRDLRPEHGQQAFDVVGDFDGVAAGLAHDGQADAGGTLRAILLAVIVDFGELLVVLHAIDHAGHVAQPDRRPVPVGYHHGPVVPGLHQLAVDLHVVGCVRAVKRAGGDVDVPIAQGLVDFIESDAAGGQLVRIHLHPHGVLGGAIDLHLGHAFHHGNTLRQHGFGILVEVAETHGGRA